MSRKYYGYYDKKLEKVIWIDPDGEVPKEEKPKAPNIRTDEIPPTESMATCDRQIFTSLAKLDAHYAAHGYERCHPDDRKKKPPKPFRVSPEEIHEMAEKAYYDEKYGRVPHTEKERETCRREERAFRVEQKARKTRWV